MKIAVIQNKWYDNIEDGLCRIVDKAKIVLKNKDTDFLLLPEFFLGPAWFQPGQSELKGITDDKIPGEISENFSEIAKEYRVNIVMGTIVERRAEQHYNTSVFIDRDGNIVEKISKMHTFAGEKANCIASDHTKVISTDKGKVGIAVCSDFWIPEYMKILVLKGAEIIFIPGGTLGQNTEPMITALKAISYLTSAIVVYSSAVGIVTGMRGMKKVSMAYTGSSMIVSPENVLAVGCRDEEDILTVDISDHYIEEYRKNSLCWQRLRNANQKVFGEIIQDYIGIEQ